MLSGMMGIVNDPVGHFKAPVEPPFTGEVPQRASAATAGIGSGPVGRFGHSVAPPFTEEVSRETSAAADLDTEPVSHFSGRVERPFTVEGTFTGGVYRETIVAPPGLVSDPTGDFNPPVEHRLTREVFRGPNAASEIFYKIRLGLEERWSEKRGMLLAVVAVLLLSVLAVILWTSGATLWRSGGNAAGTVPVNSPETKAVALPPSNPEDKGRGQPAISAESETPAPAPKATKSSSQEEPKEKSKPQERSVAAKPALKAPAEKQAGTHDDAVLRLPPPVPRDVAEGKKEEAPPNGTAGMLGSVPGGMPNAASNNVVNIVKDVPVVVPKIGAQKVRISSGVAQGLLLHEVKPQYPSQARQAHVQGTVVLQVVIGKDGAVQSLHVVSGHPMLNQAALDAVRRWRYKPYRLDGEPVEADTQINVNFTLAGEY